MKSSGARRSRRAPFLFGFNNKKSAGSAARARSRSISLSSFRPNRRTALYLAEAMQNRFSYDLVHRQQLRSIYSSVDRRDTTQKSEVRSNPELYIATHSGLIRLPHLHRRRRRIPAHSQCLSHHSRSPAVPPPRSSTAAPTRPAVQGRSNRSRESTILHTLYADRP